MFIKVAKSSLIKNGEHAAGDCILIKRYKDADKIIAVLSDGLGSGIKANILSNMTAKMLIGFANNNADLVKSCEIVMDSLPVCKIRGISYSTFSVVIADNMGNVKIIEEGNPDFIRIRKGEIKPATPEIIDSKTHKDRHLKVYNLSLEIDDILIFVSDGVTQAGLGSKNLKDGVTRDGLIKIALNHIKNENFTPQTLADTITTTAKMLSVDSKPHDDISALVLKAQEPLSAVLFTGPPYDEEQDASWADTFEKYDGKKAVSGGTTAKILSRELKKELVISNENRGSLPAESFMDGADLVVEGILTLTRCLEYLENESYETKKDAAEELSKFFLEADNIDIIVGAKVNTAHYDPNLPVEIELRKDVVKKIAKVLSEKYFKKVSIQYI